MFQRRSLAIGATIALISTLAITSPSNASGNASLYLNIPLFTELATDMGYTAALLSNSEHTIVLAGETVIYSDGLPSGQYRESVSVSETASVIQVSIHNWNVSTNSWGPAMASEKSGYYNGTSYVEINVTNNPNGPEALRRLKKTGAKWVVKKNSFDGMQTGMYSPIVLRPSLTSSTILTSIGEMTYQGSGTISNISVSRDTPSVGTDTFTLTSVNGSGSSDFTYVVNSDHIVVTARQEEYIADGNTSIHQNSDELRIVDLASTVPVPNLLGASDLTVDSTTYFNMQGRIASEKGITPSATSIKNKAVVLARAAKGKNKNVVTAKVIQNAAKALRLSVKSTKTGIRITGALEFPDVRGYMCVSAVKKKAVVTNC